MKNNNLYIQYKKIIADMASGLSQKKYKGTEKYPNSYSYGQDFSSGGSEVK